MVWVHCGLYGLKRYEFRSTHWNSFANRSPVNGTLNSLRPSDAISRHRTWSTLVQVMAWPLSEPILTYCQNQCTLIFIPENVFENAVCANVAHFVHASLCEEKWNYLLSSGTHVIRGPNMDARQKCTLFATWNGSFPWWLKDSFHPSK